MTGLGFAMRLAVRRVAMAQPNKHEQPNKHGGPPWLLWCWPRALASEFGAPLALGLAGLGLDPSRLLIVETARASDALVALEDGLKSSSLALAFGIFDEIALTPSRRLSLAAATSATPCLLITHPASQPSGATATRWRVGRQHSGPHPYDARAPGDARFLVNLERCRSRLQSSRLQSFGPQSPLQRSQLLEWCDETRAFSLAAGLADRTALPHRARCRSA